MRLVSVLATSVDTCYTPHSLPSPSMLAVWELRGNILDSCFAPNWQRQADGAHLPSAPWHFMPPLPVPRPIVSRRASNG